MTASYFRRQTREAYYMGSLSERGYSMRGRRLDGLDLKSGFMR
jgi:hypothetical protein